MSEIKVKEVGRITAYKFKFYEFYPKSKKYRFFATINGQGDYLPL